MVGESDGRRVGEGVVGVEVSGADGCSEGVGGNEGEIEGLSEGMRVGTHDGAYEGCNEGAGDDGAGVAQAAPGNSTSCQMGESHEPDTFLIW